MERSQAELLARQRRLQEIYPEAQRELMQIPGVVKVGIGIKETNGELTGETVFRVYVEEKKAPEEIPSGEMIPQEIHGFKTDVVIVRPEYPEDDASKSRPVKAGVQINREAFGGVGTLGCFAHLISDIDTPVVLLSNHHVLYGGTGKDGTEIGQPDHERLCCCVCNDIAVNVHGIKRDHLDCAIAKMKLEAVHDARIKEIGFITGVNNAVAGQIVKKRGRTTGLTTGTVTNLTMDATGTKILEIEVKKNNGQDRFSRGGDSGSALLNSANEIVGLHKSGNNGDEVTPGNFLSTSIGIQEVLDALRADGFQITIITGTGGDEEAERSPGAPTIMSDALWEIELRLKESEVGRRLWEAVRRNQKEILRLVNEERPVTVAWHRKKGPIYLAALGRSAKEPSYRIPAEIEGVSRREAATTILAALETHGSEALRSDLKIYSASLYEAFTRSDSLDEMIRSWQEAAVEGSVMMRM